MTAAMRRPFNPVVLLAALALCTLVLVAAARWSGAPVEQFASPVTSSRALMLIPLIYALFGLRNAPERFVELHLLPVLLLFFCVVSTNNTLRVAQRGQLHRLALQLLWEREERHMDGVLSLMLPPSVLRTLKTGESQRVANAFNGVSILFGA